MPDVMQYMNDAGTLQFGGILSKDESDSMKAGALRAKGNLENAATLSVIGNTVRVVNLTGHKLISGYPEGRRTWRR
jgi:hypothetical protein